MAKINGNLSVSGSCNLNSLNVLASSVFNGTVTIPEPTLAAHSATKNYVDTTLQSGLNTKISKSGDTLTGYLILSANPTMDFHASTKQYVDMKTVGGAFDIHSYYPGIPQSSVNLIRNPIARNVLFPSNFTGSYAYSSTPSTGTSTFIINLINGSTTTPVGTIIFGPGSNIGTFSNSGNILIEPGTIINIVSPATPDSTLSDVGIVLYGTRSN